MPEFGRRELPAILTVPWAWILGASIIEQALRAYFHWPRWSSFNVIEVWSYVQAILLLKLDRRSTALYWYLSGDVLLLGSWLVQGRATMPTFVVVIFTVVLLVVVICGVFVFRHDMERYFNEVDDVGLKLSPWMTLFFNTIYFQYHFHKIAQFKKRHPEPASPDLA